MTNHYSYPDIYYRMHPYVMQVYSQWKQAKAPINESTVDAMTDHVCALALQDDPSLQHWLANDEVQTEQFGGSLFRNIISIILIGELLRNRRRPPPPPYPPRPPYPRPY